MTREDVVREARSWIGTPYHLRGQVKGAGCDCATLILCCYRNCGLIKDEQMGIFSGDWWVHTTEQKYMLRILRHAAKVAETVAFRAIKAEPGNIVLTATSGSKVYNHGGIITEWPKVVHAMPPQAREVDASIYPGWCQQQIVIFDPWVKAES